MSEKFVDVDLDVTEGEWFPFQTSHVKQDTGEIVWDDPVMDDEGNPVAALCIRPMAPYYEAQISKRGRIVEHVYNPKNRSMERVVSIKELPMEDIKKERDNAIDYAITGIKGFRDKATKKLLDCTRENKIAMLKSPAIDRFFAYCQERLGQSEIKNQEAEAENFTNGSNG
jgi:hypothetical protein